MPNIIPRSRLAAPIMPPTPAPNTKTPTTLLKVAYINQGIKTHSNVIATMIVNAVIFFFNFLLMIREKNSPASQPEKNKLLANQLNCLNVG
ncbi:MAG: hypothetical protein D3904_05215 [Candidatus Electrothrix sp. EH2]|nr:hypothetical protein [Candidatus Electrothrix sp. EH2]